MARKRSKPTVVNNQLTYSLPDGTSYIDIFKDLSAVNRKLIRQGRIAYITDIQYIIHQTATGDAGVLQIQALPNTWVVNNAWKKAQAHWLGQQKRALSTTGSGAKPTWHDFKVYYDASHRTGNTLAVQGLSYGEWMYSKLYYETDANAVQEWNIHVLGDNVSTTDKGLVLNYQASRATVQAEDPDVPTTASTNMYALMQTDIDSVSDEVMNDMEDTNDAPPYDHDDYPGNDSNFTVGHVVNMMATGHDLITNSHQVICAPLGLLKILHGGINKDTGGGSTAPTAFLNFRIAYGNYKGLAAPSFGQ